MDTPPNQSHRGGRSAWRRSLAFSSLPPVPDLARNEEARLHLDLAPTSFTSGDRFSLMHKVLRLQSLVADSTPARSYLCSDDLKSVFYSGYALGELDLERERAVMKGIRHMPYQVSLPLNFASATIGVPRRGPARAAHLVAQKIISLREVALRDSEMVNDVLTELSDLNWGVTYTAAEHVIRHYGVSKKLSSVLFDDNASTALYILLGLLKGNTLGDGSRIVSFFDTGRVIPDAMEGRNPETLPFNFQPTIDIWCNKNRSAPEANRIGTFRPTLIEHFIDGKYQGDSGIIAKVIESIGRGDDLARIFIIPTVTRVGRRLPFVEISLAIREYFQRHINLETPPFIVIDDCQGLGRIRSVRYTKGRDHSQIPEISNIWDYADCVIFTGAKVLGALLGAGGALIKTESLQKFGAITEPSEIRCRLRKYSFISSDRTLQDVINSYGQGILNTPEVASLSIAMEELPNLDAYNKTIDKRLKLLRKEIVADLQRIPHLYVLETSDPLEVKFIDSVIAFYLVTTAEAARDFKTFLATPLDEFGEQGEENHNPHPYNLDSELDKLPITTAALFHEGNKFYFRLALTPHAVRTIQSFRGYRKKVNYTLKRIRHATEHFAPHLG